MRGAGCWKRRMEAGELIQLVMKLPSLPLTAADQLYNCRLGACRHVEITMETFTLRSPAHMLTRQSRAKKMADLEGAKNRLVDVLKERTMRYWELMKSWYRRRVCHVVSHISSNSMSSAIPSDCQGRLRREGKGSIGR